MRAIKIEFFKVWPAHMPESPNYTGKYLAFLPHWVEGFFGITASRPCVVDDFGNMVGV
jgi:hypothetical protein